MSKVATDRDPVEETAEDFVLPPSEERSNSQFIHSQFFEMEMEEVARESPKPPETPRAPETPRTTLKRRFCFSGDVKYVTRIPFVPFTVVTTGSVICFSLTSQDPISLLNDPMVKSANGRLMKICNTPYTIQRFLVGKKYSRFSTFYVVVVSRVTDYVLRIFAAALCSVVMGVIMMRLSQECQRLIEAKDIFYGYTSLESMFFKKSFPLFVLALYILVLGLCIFFLDPCRRIFTIGIGHSRGYALSAHTKVRVAVCVAGILGLMLILGSWVVLRKASRGFSSVVSTVCEGLVSTINEVVSITRTVDYILRQVKSLYNTEPPPEALALLLMVNDTMGSLQKYTAEGTTVSTSFLQLLSAVGFVSAQGVVVTCVLAVTAVVRRNVKLLRLLVMVTFLALVVCIVDLAVRAFLMGIVELSSGTTQRVIMGKLNVSQHTDSEVVKIVVHACIGVHDNRTAHTGAEFLITLLDDLITTKLNPLLNSSKIPPIILPPETLHGALTLTKYTPYIGSQLSQLTSVMADPLRYRTLKSLVPEQVQLTEEIWPLVTASVAVLSSLFSVLECRRLHASLGTALIGVKHDVEYNQVLGFIMQTIIAGILFAIFVIGALAAHILSHPRKNWYEPRTNRWFLFRATFRAHRRLLLRGVQDKNFCRSECSIVEVLTSIELISFAATFVTFLQAAFLLLASPAASLVPAVITLVVGSLSALLSSTVPLKPILRRFFYGISCTMYCVAVIVCLAALDEATKMATRCLKKRLYFNLRGTECLLSDVMRNLELSIYLGCIVGGTFLGVMSSIIVAICIRRKPLDPQIALHVALPSQVASFRFNRGVRVSCRKIVGALILLVMLIGIVALAPRWVQAVDPDVVSVRTCNGFESLCGVAVHQAPWAASHNTMSSSEDGFVLPNNFFGVEAALYAGVRVLMLDIWPRNGSVYLCHVFCDLGGYPFIRDMRRLHRFLEKFPGEVVMLMLEQYVPAQAVSDILQEAGLMQYVWSPPRGLSPGRTPHNFTWPTLGELVRSGRRLLVFGDVQDEPDFPWFMYQWDFSVETMYGLRTPAEVAECPLHRGKRAKTYQGNKTLHDGMLLVHNVFIADPVSTPELSDRVNQSPVLDHLVDMCGQFWDRAGEGTVVAVDFWSLGDVVAFTRKRIERISKGI